MIQNVSRPVAAAALPATLGFPRRLDQGQARIAPGSLSRAALAIGDILTAIGVVFSIPFVILAVGIPIALFVRFLLWIAGLL